MLCLYFQHLSINVSIFTLVVIALDRYRGILWPLKGGYSKFRAKIHLMIVWFLATVVALPNLILFHVSQDLVSFRAALAATCHAWPLPLITLSKLEGEKWSVDGHLVDFVLQKKCIFEACLFPYLTSKASVWPFSDFSSTFFSWLTIPTSKESLVASLTWKLLAVKGLGKIILW